MKDWIKDHSTDLIHLFGCIGALLCICTLFSYIIAFWKASSQERFSQGNLQWGGYAPMNLYKVFDKETGVYYVITESGDIELLVDKKGNPCRVDEEG